MLREAKSKILEEVDVIFTTCKIAADMNLDDYKIDEVIIDEAGLCTKILSLAPVIRNKPSKVVLVGDPQQLIPYCLNKEAAEGGLHRSLLTSFSHHEYVNNLNIQYRMHESIAQLSSDIIYNYRLESKNAWQRSKPEYSIWPNKNLAYLFWDVQGREETIYLPARYGRFTYCNQIEAERAFDVLEYLLNKGISIDRIAILTFEKGQELLLEEIYQKLKNKNRMCNGLTIQKVSKSQGSEWDYVILSCVRSGWGGTTLSGCIKIPNHLNVAITRARKGLIIIGNSFSNVSY